jgi:bifunctional enzyme CysN/CysC
MDQTATRAADSGLLRFLTCGSVDDGKSTLIGRLLHDTRQVPLDRMAALKFDSRRHGASGDELDLALLLDGLEAEREQGITIDVAHIYFATPRRAFIVADTPGHEQYTRNMATGASEADLAIILVDARKGVLTQTRRHATLCALLGLRHVVLAVNKIDLVGYDEGVFRRIVDEFLAFAGKIGLAGVAPFPLCARHGDNVATRSPAMPWYDGPTLLEHLETVDVSHDTADAPFRMSVQWVSRPHADFRGFAGTVASGRVRVGDEIAVLPSARTTRISRIFGPDDEREAAEAGEAVTLTFADEVDAARGDLVASVRARPTVADQFAARLVWMTDEPLLPGRSYMLRIGDAWTPASVTALKYRLDVDTQAHLAAKSLDLNAIGEVNVATGRPVAFDLYAQNRATGSFILVDRFTNATAAAGMILHPLRRATNVHHEPPSVKKEARAALKGQKPACIWFTGLSGSGKSTIAKALEKKLHAMGKHTMLLDGDNLRHGLNKDLGFTDADRVENIRRVGEMAHLMTEAGLIVLCCFISPFRAERDMARALFPEGEFFEVFVNTSLEDCIRRDTKGLYAKALRGEIPNFTGISSAYEQPVSPEAIIATEGLTPEDAADGLLRDLSDKHVLT